MTYFDATGDRSALDSAARDLKSALAVWERLAQLTDGLYPEQMAFGPDDVGHWKDKLPYVRHDLELVRERAEVFDRFGRFDFGFDFGGPVKPSPGPAVYRANTYVLANTVAPGFRGVDAETVYTDALGYGWADGGDRKIEAIALTPYLEVRAAAKNPSNLPHNVLYRDFVRGIGRQTFRVRSGPGEYTVRFLRPDRTESVAQLKADGDYLNVKFPEGEWSVSALVVQGARSKEPLSQQTFARAAPRPSITHQPPVSTSAGTPLRVDVQITPSKDVARVRLHYRAVNQQAKFKTVENDPGKLSFSIPAEDISAKWDLMYYFEVLSRGGSGWFQPDPQVATPYYVVKVNAAPETPKR